VLSEPAIFTFLAMTEPQARLFFRLRQCKLLDPRVLVRLNERTTPTAGGWNHKAGKQPYKPVGPAARVYRPSRTCPVDRPVNEHEARSRILPRKRPGYAPRSAIPKSAPRLRSGPQRTLLDLEQAVGFVDHHMPHFMEQCEFKNIGDEPTYGDFTRRRWFVDRPGCGRAPRRWVKITVRPRLRHPLLRRAKESEADKDRCQN
jgi:hypothetical protein